MKQVLFATLIVMAYSTPALCGTAKWTGKQLPMPESTGYTAKCEYTDGVVKFWRLTNGACQPTVQATSGAIPQIGTTKTPGNRKQALKTYL